MVRHTPPFPLDTRLPYNLFVQGGRPVRAGKEEMLMGMLGSAWSWLTGRAAAQMTLAEAMAALESGAMTLAQVAQRYGAKRLARDLSVEAMKQLKDPLARSLWQRFGAEITRMAAVKGAAGAAGAGAGATATGISAATIAGVVVVGGAIVLGGIYGWFTWGPGKADEPSTELGAGVQESLDEAHAQQTAAAMNPPAEVTGDDFVVVQLTNHGNKALSVLSGADYEAHKSDENTLLLCTFLHGGRCADEAVETPNGIVYGEDIPADIKLLGGAASVEAAWDDLCGRVSGVFPTPLAEGFSATYGGDTVTIDSRHNYIFVAAPC